MTRTPRINVVHAALAGCFFSIEIADPMQPGAVMSNTWTHILAFWGYGSLALIAGGTAIARWTFLKMSWRVGVPRARRAKPFSKFWISGTQAKKVLNSFQKAEPGSKLYRTNKLAGTSATFGLISIVAWVVTICFLIVHLKG